MSTRKRHTGGEGGGDRKPALLVQEQRLDDWSTALVAVMHTSHSGTSPGSWNSCSKKTSARLSSSTIHPHKPLQIHQHLSPIKPLLTVKVVYFSSLYPPFVILLLFLQFFLLSHESHPLFKASSGLTAGSQRAPLVWSPVAAALGSLI